MASVNVKAGVRLLIEGARVGELEDKDIEGCSLVQRD